MSPKTRRGWFRRARTAASLPARVVDCENRCDALEARVADQLVEMRAELAQIRGLLDRQVEADADTTELIGRLLQTAQGRLDALEERETRSNSATPRSEAALGTGQQTG